MLKLICFSLLLIMILGVTLAHGQESAFTLYSDEPIVSHGESADWDGQYTDPGAVLYHDGLFHMFRNGFRGWPASVQWGYLTSEDGLNWTEVSPDPVMTTDQVPYAKVAALASSALVEDDGTWVMYFYTWDSTSSTTAPGAIGRATAPTPNGPWKPDSEPVLLPGSEGAWDDLRATAPHVVHDDEGYRMYYDGVSKTPQTSRIGMATSPDGITWTKYDDPETTDTLFAVSDPVLWLEADSNREFIHQPLVQRTPDGWVMVYRHFRGRGRNLLYYTTSEDGIHWELSSAPPIWENDTITRSVGFWYTALVHHQDTYYLYVEGGRGSHTDIYVSTHEGALQ
jgi:sucrose-6-phosphate hydrolase SacC (GH32 family)